MQKSVGFDGLYLASRVNGTGTKTEVHLLKPIFQHDAVKQHNCYLSHMIRQSLRFKKIIEFLRSDNYFHHFEAKTFSTTFP